MAQARQQEQEQEQGALGRVAVLSPGGVGGLVAGILARGGHDVTVVATESTAQVIDRHGLRVESAVFGDFTVHPPAVPRLTGGVDVLFVGAKATALTDALERVPPETVDGALVVPLLNGFEHMGLLRAALPRARVPGASIRVESTRVEPGRIVQTSPFAVLDIARDPAASRIDALAGALSAAGMQVHLRDDEDEVLWRKFHFLLPTALVCAHSGQDAATVRVGPRRDDLVAVAEEVRTVAAAVGQTGLDTGVIVRMVDSVPVGTKPSMLRDREAGRPMEVDALGGAFLRIAGAAGVDAPVTARIVGDLRRIDAAPRRP